MERNTESTGKENAGGNGMSPEKTASYCRHYAMCKIDFLNTGICASGSEKHFVSYYPQGRMDLYAALTEGRIPLTEKAVEIAEDCDLCGICDRQCHFITGMRPVEVARSLKSYVEENKNQVTSVDIHDPVYDELACITGEAWCSKDPAICISYANDPSPATEETIPGYVILPGSVEDVSAIMKVCKKHGLDFAVRGNGSSVMGFVMSHDLVIDMARMKQIELDEEKGLIKAGAGVAAYELQQAATEKGYRVQTAEPAALVVANLMCSGIFSTYSHAYGMGAQNVIDAQFVDPEGNVFRLSEKTASNLFAYEKRDVPIPGVCTEASFKLYPRLPDERGFLVPFSSFGQALGFLREIGRRRTGLAAGLLGGEYLATFLSPSTELAKKVKNVLHREFGMAYVVQMIGDRYDESNVRDMGYPVISQRVFRALLLSLPDLQDNEVLVHLNEMMEGSSVYQMLADKKMEPLIETVLQPEAKKLAGVVPDDLKPFYIRLYENPQMTDLVWLTDFRILSSRMGREKHVVAWIVYVPLDNPELIMEINREFKRIGDKWNVKNDYGFITPLDFGKRAVFEYDYYVDQQNDKDRMHMLQAMEEMAGIIEGYSAKYDAVRWIRYTLYQGIARMENILYT
ncbi:MAG: FAD-dependent oxidoreductase [Bacteroidales bacterium]